MAKPVLRSAPSVQIVILFHLSEKGIVIPFPTKRNQCFLEKWLIPGLRQEMYKMSLELLAISDRKEADLKRFPLTKDGTI